MNNYIARRAKRKEFKVSLLKRGVCILSIHTYTYIFVVRLSQECVYVCMCVMLGLEVCGYGLWMTLRRSDCVYHTLCPPILNKRCSRIIHGK